MVPVQETIQTIQEAIALYPDFPKPGILFEDLSPIYKDQKLFAQLVDVFAKKINELGSFDYIAGIEARGFIIGSVLAYKLGCGFFAVRKKGKLPGKVNSVEYTLEYGKDTLQIQDDPELKNKKILIIDDVFATGGTMKAVLTLLSAMTDNLALGVLKDIKISDINNLKVPYKVLFE